MYEIDGYTEYIFRNGKGEVLQNKRGYIAVVSQSEADGTEILDYVNYPSFPIVPCWANDLKQSELEPIRPTIDAYDLIQSGYANDVDDANVIYWTITNAGGMDDADLVATINKLKKLHAAQTDDDQQMTPHQVEAPFQGREAILARLEKTLYKDAMAFNPYDVANGAITATQIEAAYDPLNQKLDIYEAQITNFIHRLLAFTGVEDTPSYTRSYNINKAEEIRAIMDAALVLDDEYMTKKIMTILGDKDQISDVLARKAETDLNRMTGGTNNANTQTE
jgi:SPP1 family phage portal protein